MTATTVGIIGILVFVALIMFKMPISFAMAFVGFLGFSYLTSPSTAFRMVSQDLFSNFSSYSLSVIAMFTWMGFLAFYSGIGSNLYHLAYKCIGHLPGGLAIATQAACAVFGAICGSNTATAATMGAIALPEMRKYKYNMSMATASIAAGGVLGILIPPSVILIVYGMATEQSIGSLFLAGIVPGILLMLFYMAIIFLLATKYPELAPRGEKATWGERVKLMRTGLLDVFIVFSLSIGGLFAGWFTPTEAGAVGAAGVILVALFEKRLNWENFNSALWDTTRTTGMIMLMVAGAVIFGKFIALSRIPFELAQWAANMALPPFAVMTIILGIYLVMGFFIDALAMVLLTIPIFYPVVVNTLGYDPIWFGVIIVLVVSMGVITPPVGMNVYVIKGVAPEIPLEQIFKGIWPFLGAQVICLAILMLFPQLVTFLPNLLVS